MMDIINRKIPTKIPREVMEEGLEVMRGDNIIRVGKKGHAPYMFACTMCLADKGKVGLISRGLFNTKTLDILEQLKEQEKLRGGELDVKMSTRTEIKKIYVDFKKKNKYVTVLEVEVRRQKI